MLLEPVCKIVIFFHAAGTDLQIANSHVSGQLSGPLLDFPAGG